MHEKSCTNSRARLRINRDFVQNRGTINRARKFVHEFFVISNPACDRSGWFFLIVQFLSLGASTFRIWTVHSHDRPHGSKAVYFGPDPFWPSKVKIIWINIFALIHVWIIILDTVEKFQLVVRVINILLMNSADLILEKIMVSAKMWVIQFFTIINSVAV